MSEATVYGAGSDLTEAIGPRLAAIPAAGRGETIRVTGYHETGSDSEFGISGTFTAVAGGHRARIRKSGTVTGVRLKVNDEKELITALKFIVIRYVSGGATPSFTKVGESEDFGANPAELTNGQWCELEFSSPITGVQAGDFIGYVCISSADCDLVRLYDGTGLADDDWKVWWQTSEWTSGTFVQTSSRNSFGIQALTDSPVITVIGDSIAAGSSCGQSSIYNLSNGNWWGVDPLANISGHLYGFDNTLFDTMNHGYGSSDSDDWATSGGDYITTWCIDYYPQAAIIALGLNDIEGSVAYSTFEANIANIIQTLRSNSVIPVMLTITPFHGGTSAQKDSVRTWNKNLKRYCAKRGIIVVDAWRAINDPADADSISTSAPDLHSTGVHPNSAGYQAIAAAIAPHVIAQR